MTTPKFILFIIYSFWDEIFCQRVFIRTFIKVTQYHWWRPKGKKYVIVLPNGVYDSRLKTFYSLKIKYNFYVLCRQKSPILKSHFSGKKSIFFFRVFVTKSTEAHLDDEWQTTREWHKIMRDVNVFTSTQLSLETMMRNFPTKIPPIISYLKSKIVLTTWNIFERLAMPRK